MDKVETCYSQFIRYLAAKITDDELRQYRINLLENPDMHIKNGRPDSFRSVMLDIIKLRGLSVEGE